MKFSSILLTVFIFEIRLLSAQQNDEKATIMSLDLGQKVRYELGITFRFAGQIDYKLSDLDSNHFSWFEGIHRIQFGRLLSGSHYIEFCYDHFFRNVSEDFPYKKYKGYTGTGLSLQYNYKIHQTSAFTRIKLFGRWYPLCITPEAMLTLGFTNMRSGFEYSEVRSSKTWSPYWSFGTGLSIRPVKFFEFVIVYQIEYYPSIKSYPIRNLPQFKFNFRI